MCKSKMSTDATQPMKSASSTPTTTNNNNSSSSSTNFCRSRRSSSNSNPSSSSQQLSVNNYPTTTTTTTTTGGSSYKDSSWKSSISSRTSLSSLKDSLPEAPHIYHFSEIRSATNNFLSKPFSSSSSSTSWRCNLRNKDVIIFQRKLRRPIETPDLQRRLSLICRSHHTSLIKLQGVSISGNYIYFVYDYVDGANLFSTLRNPRNPSFTVLSTWLSRMMVATDLAHGLDYVHHCTGLNTGFVHNHIKSSSIIVVEPTFNARICHFGTAELCGEVMVDYDDDDDDDDDDDEIRTEVSKKKKKKKKKNSKDLKRSESRTMKFEGTRGYMAPEFQNTGMATKETDVFAFGVVILELLSGEEALRYYVDKETGGYRRVSVIETARDATANGGELRKWVDRRLKDSFPVDVAEKMVRLGLECVDSDPGKRPDMGQITGRISKLYLKSRNWADRMGVPTDFSVSMAPR